MQRGMRTDTYRVCHSSLRTPPATRRNFRAESYENFIMNRRGRGEDIDTGLDYGMGKRTNAARRLPCGDRNDG